MSSSSDSSSLLFLKLAAELAESLLSHSSSIAFEISLIFLLSEGQLVLPVCLLSSEVIAQWCCTAKTNKSYILHGMGNIL